MEQRTRGGRRPSRRGGARAGNATRRGKTQVIKQSDWVLPVNTDKPTEPLDEEGVQAIHRGAMRVLEEIGIEFLNEEAKEILRTAGCTAASDSDNVKMDRDFVLEQVGKAPSQFDITPRNKARKMTLKRRPPSLFFVCFSPPALLRFDESFGNNLIRGIADVF